MVFARFEATWLNSAIAMTHFIAGLTDGSHAAEEFQKIIGIDEKTRQIDADGLFAPALWPPSSPLLQKQPRNWQISWIVTRRLEKNCAMFLEARDKTLAGVGSVANGDVITPPGELHDSDINGCSHQ